MSIHATVLAWDADVKPLHKLMLLALAEDNVGDSDGEFVSVDLSSLAISTGQSPSEALDLLQEMHSIGVIEIATSSSRLFVRDRYESYHANGGRRP